MDKGQPWSVKGIDPETRQAAKMAARRAGLTVGAWLNNVIQHAAAAEAGMPPPLGGADPHRGYAPGIPAHGMPQPPLQAHPATWPGEIPRSPLGQPVRGDELAARAVDRAVDTAVDTLLDAMRRQTDEVKTAIRNSAEEVRYSSEKIQPISDRLRPMSDRLDQIASRLEQVGEVDRRLAEAESKADRAALQVTPLERTLTRLFERLDAEDQPSFGEADGRYRRRGLFGKLFGD